ncbi:hypothetical protein [Desertivirga arenae]|uniref:hypothetical protein n=1 Tax=Desertivirga arenae TaxID=2810309 RepID=UPI001A96D6A5|nr:hypothetical protein [Pedobacter sp. SYSU D00823]
MSLKSAKYTFPDLVELTLYADLAAGLKNNDRVVIDTDEEFMSVKEILTENNIGYKVKSKREVLIQK